METNAIYTGNALFLHRSLILSFYIDVVLTLSTEYIMFDFNESDVMSTFPDVRPTGTLMIKQNDHNLS